MTTVLVTGASGLIGRHCLPLLLARGYEVHALCRRGSSRVDLLDVAWHELDLLRPGCAAELIRSIRPDSLLHLAWCAVPGKFWDAQENVEWVRASLELVSAFSQHRGARIVTAGSCAEYGLAAGECIEGATPLVPTSLYGRSKQALETSVRASAEQSGMSFAWGRIFFLYGPHEHPERPVAYVVRALLKGEPAACSEGTQVVDFLHVEDVASALVALLESGVRGPVNIGSGKPVSLRTVFETIGAQIGRSELVRFGARETSSQPYRVWANTQRLADEVGWTPRYDLDSGIRQTIEWWRRSLESSIRA